MDKLPISVVVITKNEESRIEQCLKSVYGWVEEIIVVDDESTDKTVSLAQKYADKIFHRKMEVEGSHRNWAYAQASSQWVFSLDADEIVTEELKKEIQDVLPNTSMSLFSIPRRNYIGDYWVKYGGQYPSAQLRLFRKGCFRYEDVEVHPAVAWSEGQRGILSHDIIHKSYRDFSHFLSKLNNQTTLEATKWFKSNKEFFFGKTLWRALDRFPRAYLRKKGYKDGFIGFMFAFFASLYQIMSYAKYWEMKRKSQNA
ncbi:MAG TPA: glycosyltransferase family 2 protein [Candidatus Omnitrophota bacterium]|nr:glycosyltransferase family 2 protein [Candidatus Omnitrophota bacterium]